MSYILQAIKRSEQQRRSIGTAALRAAPLFADREKDIPLLLYGLAATALIAAGIAIGWLRPWQHRDAAVPEPAQFTAARNAPAQNAPTQNAPSQNAPARAARAEPAPADPLRATDTAPPVKVEALHVMEVKPYRPPAPAQVETPPAAAAPRVAAAAPTAPTPVAPVTQAAPVVAPVAPPTAPAEAPAAAPGPVPAPAEAAAPAEARILALYELPPAVLRELPQMSISGYSYSNTAKDRLVGINDRLMQEGQYVADGLRLEQITPDGLVFSYKHYRFRKSLP